MAGTDLVLHCGASEVTRESLAEIKAPSATDTWHPVSHVDVLTNVESTLSAAGFHIEKARYGLSKGGHRFFGTLDLTTPVSSGVALAVGVRNSIDKTFPLGFCAGHRCFVCDNLAFHSELLVNHKHTRFGVTRFQEAIALAVSGLEAFRQTEEHRIKRLQLVDCTDVQAESLMLRAYEHRMISARQLPHVIKEWREPRYEEFQDRTLWSLLNSFTTVMNDRVKSNPQRHARATMRLQALLCPPAN